jgi:hypothetical protein
MLCLRNSACKSSLKATEHYQTVEISKEREFIQWRVLLRYTEMG